MSNLPISGRDASLVRAVSAHYADWVEAATLWNRRDDAEEDRALALAMLEAILTREPGAQFAPMEWFAASRWGSDRKRLSRVLPFFCGASKVLQMLFVDEGGIVIPTSVVRNIIEHDPFPVRYAGRTLNKGSVRVMFMRPYH